MTSLMCPAGFVLPGEVAPFLKRLHYLGSADRGIAYSDDEALILKYPWACYREPRFHGMRFSGGGADFKRFKTELEIRP